MDDFLNFYNPLNSNHITVYVLLFIAILLALFLPEKLKIFSTKGVAITFILGIVIISAHQIHFIKNLIPYF